MLSCINKNSYEFQTLKQRSGLNEFMLEAICRRFISEYDRFPYLDELPNSNSETNLREVLNIKLDELNRNKVYKECIEDDINDYTYNPGQETVSYKNYEDGKEYDMIFPFNIAKVQIPEYEYDNADNWNYFMIWSQNPIVYTQINQIYKRVYEIFKILHLQK